MNQRTIILVVSLFVLIVVGMFTFAYQKNKEIVTEPVTTDEEGLSEMENPYGITRIEAKHFYIDGVHTIAGEIDMPTPCDLLEVDMIVAESMPEQIFADFTVINTSEMCAQMITPQRFKVSASASGEASITARFMGQPVELNLVPAEEGETPEEFELFIKG